MSGVAPPNVTAARNGPGVLLEWSLIPTAIHYVVLQSRLPSLSYYALASSCCPVLPNGSLPCCPLPMARTSLQVEGLDRGIGYRWKVVAVHSLTNVTSEPTPVVTAAALPGAPHASS